LANGKRWGLGLNGGRFFMRRGVGGTEEIGLDIEVFWRGMNTL